MSIRLPVGYSDFKEIAGGEFDFVDKSLFIKEVLEDTQVVLITRPRRFGKTLNMSMLRYFLDINANAADLFANLKISQEKELFAKHHSQYPVIYLTFKDIKENTYEDAYQKVVRMIQLVYADFSNVLLNSDKLIAFQKKEINSILEGKANRAAIGGSVLFLSKCLHDHYGRKVCILIDEYDTPVQEGYLNNYYPEIVRLFRNLLGAALKDNVYLFKAVLTGILRVSKESMFSDLNNLMVYSILNQEYGDYFGFTEDEVSGLLAKANLQAKAEEIKRWYNGYQFGNHRIYNPWSIVNCIMQRGLCNLYWVNTSGNDLVRQLLIKSSESFKTQLARLFEGQMVPQLINENVVFGDLNKSESAIWSLFLMAGYLTADSFEATERGPLCQLRLPNREVRGLYRNIIEGWLADGFDSNWYDTFLDALLDGNIVEFENRFKLILERIVSVHDVSYMPEAFYHGLLVGITARLGDGNDYSLRSNRESGYGRYDYMILSHLVDKPTIIFEFKKVNVPKKKSLKEVKHLLEKAAKEALDQINSLSYLAEAKSQGASNILKMGLAFSGKRFVLMHERG